MNEKRSRDLGAVLAAAAAPPLPEEQDEQVLAGVLARFNAAGQAQRAGVGMTEPITALSPVRLASASGSGRGSGCEPPANRAGTRWSPGVRLVVQAGTLFAIFTGAGITAASTGILPSPVQSFAHSVFGGIGVPAPDHNGTPTAGASASAAPTATPGANPSPAPSPAASATKGASGAGGTGGTGSGVTNAPAASSSSDTSEASLATLCGQVLGDGNSWRSTMSAQDQARLIAAAGSDNKVHQYCAQLLHSSDGAGATPPAGGSGGSGGAAAASASPSPTKHVKGKAKSNGAADDVPVN